MNISGGNDMDFRLVSNSVDLKSQMADIAEKILATCALTNTDYFKITVERDSKGLLLQSTLQNKPLVMMRLSEEKNRA